jgi:hypothetical protein
MDYPMFACPSLKFKASRIAGIKDLHDTFDCIRWYYFNNIVNQMRPWRDPTDPIGAGFV